MRARLQSFGVIALAAAAFSVAHAEEVPTSADSTVFSGIEINNEDSHRFDLGVTLRSKRGSTLEFLGSRTETDGDALALSSSHLFGQVSHDFSRFGLGAGVRNMRDDDVAKTLGWLGSAFTEFSAGR